MDSYHSLLNVEEVKDAEDLSLPRSLVLHDAAKRHDDFTVIQILKHRDGEEPCLEIIVVDVECDEVPPKNPDGIKYRERLAFCVSRDPKLLVEVLALRKGFPILMHQNNNGPDSPASLCLYFEPPAAVLRTWTPENFLRRVQWWLEKSARGQLHPADQPVEQLFFVTKYELVLPWNFGDLQKKQEQRFLIQRGQQRPDGGETFFLDAYADQSPTKGRITPIEITLPAVTHRHVERDPITLGQLADLLNDRGGDIKVALDAVVRDRVGSEGTTEQADDPLSVILLHVPVSRAPGELPERMDRRAFLVMAGALKLGEQLGVLFIHGGLYFREVTGGVLAPPPKTDWRELSLYPMEVLQCNDSAAARRQSGIKGEGPQGVLVGGGSLGSTMQNLWDRCGWGQWTVIDKDHIKPHNLVRHVAFAQHIGMPKVEVLASLHAAVTHGAGELVPVCADATDLTQEAVVKPITAASLVVDASTTLEYPRLASMQDGFGRHLSVFITPDGNASVLLAEDADRKIRLRTLEAQYYRAVIHEEWGDKHLDSNLGSFWSGASCRDISTILPYARVVNHAATLAEQVQLVAKQPESRIRIWVRDPVAGAISAYEVPVHEERILSLDDLDLFIDYGVEERLRTLRADAAPTETGGVLLGYYDFNVNAIVVVDALPAPSDSKSDPTSFERGVAGLPEAIREVARRTAGIVQYIGEWHSHPPGHSAAPSRDDIFQLAYLSLGMAQDGLPAISLIVGEGDLRVMKGQAKG